MKRELCKACMEEFCYKSERNSQGIVTRQRYDGWLPKRDGWRWDNRGRVLCPAKVVESLAEYDLIGGEWLKWNIKDGFPIWCPNNGIAILKDERKES